MRRQIKAYHRANISHCRTKLSLAIRTLFICKNFRRGRTQRQRARVCLQHSATHSWRLCVRTRSRLANKSAMKSLQYTYLSVKIKSFAPQTAPIHYIMPQNSRIHRTPRRILRAFLPGSTALRHSPDYILRFCACILPTFIAAYIPGSAPIPQIEEPNTSTRFFMVYQTTFEPTHFRTQKNNTIHPHNSRAVM